LCMDWIHLAQYRSFDGLLLTRQWTFVCHIRGREISWEAESEWAVRKELCSFELVKRIFTTFLLFVFLSLCHPTSTSHYCILPMI
jgi:hypothetical protein